MVKFGIDVGGTSIKIGLFSEDGELLEKQSIPTDTAENGAHILTDITEKMTEILEIQHIEKTELMGVGIGLPGPVDAAGNIQGCVNLGWDTFNIEETLSNCLGGVPVKAGNDANIAALGEQTYGSGKGYQNLVMVTLGTGVGGGVIINGTILAGTNGAAGEIGHMPVNESEEECCNCGKRGCLEQYASATGIVRMAKKLRPDYKDTDISQECTAKEVCDKAKEGDSLGLAVMVQLGKYLGTAFASLACVLNPEAIVIGGGVSAAGNILIDMIWENFTKQVFPPCKNVTFLLATLGNDAGIYGAAALIK